MIRYVDEYRAQFGVEAICRTLRATECGFITARGFRAAVARPRSDRSVRDEQLVSEIARIHGANFSVYGVRKMHVAMRRAGWDVGRDQVARLMRVAGVQGALRGRRAFTTVSDPRSQRPADLVERRFAADGPGRLWVADITYVATWAGFAYTAFVTDVFSRRIVGWAVSPSLTTQALPMQALNMAAFMNTVDDTLIHHSDRGVQYVSLAYSTRLADLGIAASVGSTGDSYDNALAESVNAAYKTELIRARKPWRTVEEVELATLEWVHWFNTARLHENLGHRTPAEVEHDYYADHTRAPALTTT